MSKRSRASSMGRYSKKSKSMQAFKPRTRRSRKTIFRKSSSLTSAQKAKLSGIEHKYCDYAYTQTAVVRSATIAGCMLTPVSSSEGGTANAVIGSLKRGEQVYQRDGNQVFVDEIHIKGWVKFAGQEAVVDPPEGSIVSILLYQDMETNGAVASSSLVATNPVGIGASAPNFLRNPVYTSRFNSIAHTTIACPPRPITQFAANNFTAGSTSIPFEIYKKFKTPISIRYTASADGMSVGDVTEIIDNSFQLLAVEGGDAPTIFYGATITYNARMRFYG